MLGDSIPITEVIIDKTKPIKALTKKVRLALGIFLLSIGVILALVALAFLLQGQKLYSTIAISLGAVAFISGLFYTTTSTRYLVSLKKMLHNCRYAYFFSNFSEIVATDENGSPINHSPQYTIFVQYKDYKGRQHNCQFKGIIASKYMRQKLSLKNVYDNPQRPLIAYDKKGKTAIVYRYTLLSRR